MTGAGDRVTWGDFEVHFDELLGRGGMGSVFKARQISLDRTVALKVLEPHRAPTDELAEGFEEKFEIESKSLAKLRDPRIITILQAGRNDGKLWYAMELIDGETLDARIQREGMFDPAEAAKIAVEVARALAAALKEGIIHRDVKPGNIFLTRDGSVKLGDFGLARSQAFRPSRLTEMNAVAATPEYASPEQCANAPCDHRSDQYSLGAVLFELVTERPPFGGLNPLETFYKHVHEEPPKPRTLNPSVPESLERIILRCLQKEPASRYPTYEELIRDLESLPSTATAAETKPSEAPALSPQERPVLVWMVAGFVAVMVLGITAWAAISNRAPVVPSVSPVAQMTPSPSPTPEPPMTPESPSPVPSAQPSRPPSREKEIRRRLDDGQAIEALKLMKEEGLDLAGVESAARRQAWEGVDASDRTTIRSFLDLVADEKLADELAGLDSPFDHPSSRAFDRAAKDLYVRRRHTPLTIGEIRSWKQYPGSEQSRWDAQDGLKISDPGGETWLSKSLEAGQGFTVRIHFNPRGGGAWAGAAMSPVKAGELRLVHLLAVDDRLIASIVERREGKAVGRGEIEIPKSDSHELCVVVADGRTFAFVDGRLVGWGPWEGPGSALSIGVFRGEAVVTDMNVAR